MNICKRNRGKEIDLIACLYHVWVEEGACLKQFSRRTYVHKKFFFNNYSINRLFEIPLIDRLKGDSSDLVRHMGDQLSAEATIS